MPQTITPYLLYEDGNAAVEFLTSAFGFTETMRSRSPEGRTWHAELALGDGALYLGEPGGDYRNPNRLGTRTSSTYVLVDDVDTHFEHAKAQAPRSSTSRPTRSTATAATSSATRKATSGSSRSGSGRSRRMSGAPSCRPRVSAAD